METVERGTMTYRERNADGVGSVTFVNLSKIDKTCKRICHKLLTSHTPLSCPSYHG